MRGEKKVKNRAVSGIFQPELHMDGRECVWLLIPLGRCVTDALLGSVERGRFRLVLVVNIAVGLCVTGSGGNITQSVFSADRWKEIIVVISESDGG